MRQLLPYVPDHDAFADDRIDDGYDWMGSLASPWEALPSWKGRQLGDWPYMCVANCVAPDPRHPNDTQRLLYGVAVYCEGDVTINGYDTRAEMNQRLDSLAEDSQ